ncbi:ABC transporter permease [Streptococcus didelphis]|uniref:ABC transporter permease n=1 Tax=Streptococcus didelphis TaxID=102886 RepID=A0ABY9LGY0_9STRE|nr:ABC transporter permease [Streptococcus didelphis]WMB28003.1 ABC transporter permease [Streptococcus didelphis]WMB29529.1 ABC transporter permease [Streptococcus didelphis]
MKKYIIERIFRSLISIVLVTTLTYVIVFTLVPTSLIFKQDPNYNKMVTTQDKKDNYRNSIFERMGYISYYNSRELENKAEKIDKNVTTEPTKANEKIYQKYIDSLGKGWELKRFEESKGFYAVRIIPIYERVWNFFSHLVVIDHPWKIQDPKNPNLKRYVRPEIDPAVGPALVGSGTTHKYLVYFNGQFPFVHQNIVSFDLGTSYPTYANIPVIQVITQGQGRTLSKEVTFPTGVKKFSPVDIYSRTYKTPSQMDSRDRLNFGKDDAYTSTQNNHAEPSMISNSFKIGIIGVLLSYVFGLPIGMMMAYYKDGLFDRFSTAATTFMLALPSIALIYIVRFLGSNLGLPDTFPLLGASDPKSYVLPALILGILGTPSTVIWFRRYLVDLQGSDFVRFARAKGLTEAEISKKHLFKHAMVPIVNGIPQAIVATIAGATLTETVFAFPGMGKMLIDAIKSANNTMVVGLVFIFAVLAILALLAGDILMTILDPRIKLSNNKGGK